jgi:hypothetical protein
MEAHLNVIKHAAFAMRWWPVGAVKAKFWAKAYWVVAAVDRGDVME